MKMRLGMKNKSLRFNINRPRPRHGHKYARYKSFSLKWCINDVKQCKMIYIIYVLISNT